VGHVRSGPGRVRRFSERRAAGHIVVRMEGQLDQFDIAVDQPGLLQLAQLPRVAQPGRHGGLGFGLQFRVFQPPAEIGPALFDQRVQPIELVERLAIDGFPPGRRHIVVEVALRAEKQLRVVVQGRLGAGQIGVAKLLRLVFDLAGLSRSDLDDLKQEMWADLLRRFSWFESDRADVKTFMARIVSHRVSAILRHRSAVGRDYRREVGSLSEPTEDSDGRTVEWAQMITEDAHDFRTGADTRSDQEQLEMATDIETVVASLPEPLRELCVLLKTDSMSAAARKLGNHWGQSLNSD